MLYYRTDEYEPWRLCIPDILYRNTIIHDNHDLPITDRPGFVQTYSKIARSYYWPGMSKDIRKHVKEVRGRKPQINHLSANYTPCLFLNDHGNQLEWTISDQYQCQKAAMIWY